MQQVCQLSASHSEQNDLQWGCQQSVLLPAYERQRGLELQIADLWVWNLSDEVLVGKAM